MNCFYMIFCFLNYQILKFKVKEIHNSSCLFQMYWFQIQCKFVRIVYVSLFSYILYIYDFKFFSFIIINV